MEIFVNLGEYERNVTITDYQELDKIMRNIMQREINLIANLTTETDLDQKVASYTQKMAGHLTRKKIIMVRSEQPMALGEVELLWVVGLTADNHISFISLEALGQIEKLITNAVHSMRALQHAWGGKAVKAMVVRSVKGSYKISQNDLEIAKHFIYASKPINLELLDYFIMAKDTSHSVESTYGLSELRENLEIELADKYDLANDKKALKRENRRLQKANDEAQAFALQKANEKRELQYNIAKQLKANGMTSQQIAQLVQLSASEIDKL
jgi:hypothetical protein